MKRIILILLFFGITANAQNIFKNEFEQLIATRTSTMNMVDPHVFLLLLQIVCTDITSELNSEFNNSLTQDSDGDGSIDLNQITRLTTDQPDYLTSRTLNASMWDADCPIPLHSAACQPRTGTTPIITTTTFSQDSTCLAPLANTTSGYIPEPNTVDFPCYATEPEDFDMNIFGSSITLSGYQQSLKYDGGLLLSDGLSRGFISETDAENFIIPPTTPIIGGMTLASLLPGGMGNCSANDDRDLGPDGITQGWWLYFNITSELVEFEIPNN